MVTTHIKTFKDKLKHHFQEIIKLQTSPHSIALGFAIGTFIEILPTPLINILLALLVVLLFPKVNKFALIGALLFWNPLFTIPLYAFSFKLGTMLFGTATVNFFGITLLDQAYNFSRKFLIANMLIAAVLAFISYFLVRIIAEIYHRRKKKQLLLTHSKEDFK